MSRENPAGRWAAGLEAWAIPEPILRQARESPWRLPPSSFAADPPGAGGTAAPSTPSRAVALRALGDGGSVLDVGCGAGAASLVLVPPATRVVGVDSSAEMLAAFAAEAAARSLLYDVVEGRWPDVAPVVPPADVAVCHHVLYNVPDLVAFARALTARARRRVVVELTERHPLTELTPLWQRFHGLDRPSGPDADLAVEVLASAGLVVRQEAWERRRPALPLEERVGFTRRRLCLPPDRDAEVAAALEERGPPAPRRVRTLWWEGGAD